MDETFVKASSGCLILAGTYSFSWLSADGILEILIRDNTMYCMLRSLAVEVS